MAQAGRGPGRDRGARLRGARHPPGDIGPRGGWRAAVGRLHRQRVARLGDRPGQCADRQELGFVVLVCLLITLVQVSSRWRTILLPPTLCLASFVWETRLVVEPSVTRRLRPFGASVSLVIINTHHMDCSGSAAWRLRHERRAAARRPVLELDRLSLSFGGLRALSELDLRVADREIVSVIGPNGAGKTTVFNVITGVYEPSAGDVRFAGAVDRGPGAARHRPAGDRADVPEPAPVPEHVRARERDGRHLR